MNRTRVLSLPLNSSKHNRDLFVREKQKVSISRTAPSLSSAPNTLILHSGERLFYFYVSFSSLQDDLLFVWFSELSETLEEQPLL